MKSNFKIVELLLFGNDISLDPAQDGLNFDISILIFEFI